MKRYLLSMDRVRPIALALAIAGLAGCATGHGGGTAALPDSGAVQGRDLGRGGATSGGLSSLDPGDNSADFSVYDARHLQR
jgi:hypothetical protein